MNIFKVGRFFSLFFLGVLLYHMGIRMNQPEFWLIFVLIMILQICTMNETITNDG